MCDRTLIAERNVCDEIGCRGKGTLRLLDFNGFRLYINSAGLFHIFPEIFSDIFQMKNYKFKRVCSLQKSSLKILHAAADISSC